MPALGSLPETGFRGTAGLGETKMRNGVRVVLYVRIKVRVATLDTNHSVIDSTQSVSQSVAASVQNLLDSVVKSVRSARHRVSV